MPVLDTNYVRCQKYLHWYGACVHACMSTQIVLRTASALHLRECVADAVHAWPDGACASSVLTKCQLNQAQLLYTFSWPRSF